MVINVLDHGYVRFVEDWGRGDAGLSEAGIVEAARQSTQGSFRGWDRDEKLLKFLYQNHHDSPFEFAGLVIEVQAPILVFREWHRHRTQSYNEMSARYEPLPDLYYIPDLDRVMLNSGGSNKQAGTVKGCKPLTRDVAKTWIANEISDCERWEAKYQQSLLDGIPKEIARLTMPVGHYSRMRAQANLRNWLAFLTLRMDPNAQWEIQQFAGALGVIIADKFPKTWGLFTEGS